MQNKTLKYKDYSPLSAESIRHAVEDINLQKHELVASASLLADDKFVIIYKEENHMEAPLEDLEKYSSSPKLNSSNTTQNIEYSGQGNDWLLLAKEHWYIAGPLGLFVAYAVAKYVIKII